MFSTTGLLHFSGTARSPRRLTSVAAAAVCVTGLAAPAAQAKLQHVDVYTARLTMAVDTRASSYEGGWSQVSTGTTITGTVHARVDGLVFVDGIPQQAGTPFTATNATEVELTQTAEYTSPLGNDSGSCRETSTEAKPMGTGLVSTALGANADDGSQQISVVVQSPDALWVEKTCEGYLRYEKADPLFQKGSFKQSYVPITEIGRSFQVPMRGELECTAFIRIQNCKTVYAGILEFEHVEGYNRGEPDPEPKPEGPIQVPPVGASDAALEAFYLKLAVRAAREDKYATAVMRCGKPCQGHVSAYAVALSKQGQAKQPAKKLGTTRFTSAADGTATTAVKLSKADRKLAQRRGGMELRAEATPVGGGQTQRVSSTVRFR